MPGLGEVRRLRRGSPIWRLMSWSPWRRRWHRPRCSTGTATATLSSPARGPQAGVPRESGQRAV